MAKKNSYIFGPVLSKRLGRSLGIDVVPFKTCTYDCIYCQLGKTTDKTIERKEYVPLNDVIEELKNNLDSNPDFITISGSGEPTLYSRLGDLINEIKKLTKIPVVVITNGSLLWMKNVRDDLLSADIVIPSLDAYDEKSFEEINRPHKSIKFLEMLNGLIQFKKEYKGKIWLEVFLVDRGDKQEEEVKKIAKICREIRPDKVQLNTATRPTYDATAMRLSDEKLKKYLSFFDDNAEIISEKHKSLNKDINRHYDNIEKSVIEMAKRHPCSINDIVYGLGVSQIEAVKIIEKLINQGNIDFILKDGERFYIPK
jgi:wyosine [tRNA(Phe)-imidazoG37] synthetase (radical SAM superfamily)